MATVNKDFKVKNGLIVEGSNATVNGNQVLTETASDQYIIDLIGGETLITSVESTQMEVVNGELNIKSGVFEPAGSIDALTTDDISEGSTNKYFTDNRVIDVLTGSTQTNISISNVSGELHITAENGVDDSTTDDLDEGTTNKYFTEQRVRDTLSGGSAIDFNSTTGEISVAISEGDGLTNSGDALSVDRTTVDAWYDAAGTAATEAGYVASDLSDHISDTSAHGVTGNVVGTSDTQTLTNKTIGDTLNFTGAGAMTINSDSHIVLTPAAGSSVKWGADVLATQAYADQAETDAKAYTDTELGSYTPTSSLDTTIDGYGYLKSADLSGYATETFVGTAIDNLVDGAPGLLDTLNEIAAAIADDENYATTMTTALAAKQNNLTAGSNISIVSDTISVTGLDSTDISDFNTAALSATSAAYDAAGAAATAQSNAEDYADGLASNYDAAGTASGLVNDLKDATTAFTAINVNSVAKQVAATTGNIVTAAQTTAISWVAADYRSAKFIVKAKNGVHTQVSDLVVTLDTANNVAVSEYGITYSNGTELAAVTADYSGSSVRIRVTPANDNTEVIVVGTLIK